MRGRLKIGRIAGVPVSLHWSLIAVGSLLALQLADGLLPNNHPGHSATTYWALGVGAAVVFFGAVLAHELAHAVVARRRGVGVDGIELWALGGLARLSRDPASPGDEFLIAVAGPVASLLAAALFLGTAAGIEAAGLPQVVAATFGWLGVTNLILGAFNLLPAAPLDGGRILRAAVWKSSGNRVKGMRTAAKAGQVLGMTVLFGGFWLVLLGRGTLFLPLIGWFLLNSARMEEVGVRSEAALLGKQVRDATWFGVARATDATDVATMLWQSSRMGPTRLVAVERFDGSLSGLVSEDQLWRIPEDQRSDVRLAQIAVPMEKLAHAGPDELLMDAARRMNPLAPVLTVWDAGRLVGVVTTDQFRKLIEATKTI